MGQAYLLTGPPRVGKTSAIKQIIDAIGKEHCAGFYTEEIHAQETSPQTRRGFRLVTLDGQNCIFAHVESKSPIHLGRYGVSLDCLESIGIAALDRAVLAKKLLIIDEIGLMQAVSDRFQRMVIELLSSSQPLLGTIALEDNAWLNTVKQQKNVKIVELTRENQKSVVNTLAHTLKVALRGDTHNAHRTKGQS